MCPLDIVKEIKSKSEVITMTDRAKRRQNIRLIYFFPGKTDTLEKYFSHHRRILRCPFNGSPSWFKYLPNLQGQYNVTDEYRVALLMEALDSNIFSTFKANVMFQSSPTYEDTIRGFVACLQDICSEVFVTYSLFLQLIRPMINSSHWPVRENCWIKKTIAIVDFTIPSIELLGQFLIGELGFG